MEECYFYLSYRPNQLLFKLCKCYQITQRITFANVMKNRGSGPNLMGTIEGLLKFEKLPRRHLPAQI